MGNTEKFEMIADSYDTPERIRIAKQAAEAIREYLVDTKDKDAIDFGCGTGLVGMDLLEDFHSILFLDTSQSMIRQIQKKIADAKIQNAKTMCFDFEQDNLSELHTDVIFMAQVLLHIKDYKPVLSKLFDVLNQEGHLIIVDFVKNEEIVSDMVHNGFDQGMLMEMMHSIGFSKIDSRVFYTGDKIFMNTDASMFVLNAQK